MDERDEDLIQGHTAWQQQNQNSNSVYLPPKPEERNTVDPASKPDACPTCLCNVSVPRSQKDALRHLI